MLCSTVRYSALLCSPLIAPTHPRLPSTPTHRAAEGKGKVIANEGLLEEYKAVNKRESDALADAILGAPFLQQQEKMASAKGKTQVAAVFKALRWTRPAWAMML